MALRAALLPLSRGAGHPLPRAAGRALWALAALAVAYLAWRGYQAPDFLLDLAAFRLC